MRMILVWIIVICGWLLSSTSAFAQSPSLRGSKASVERMARQADLHDFTRLRTGGKVGTFVEAGLLVRLNGNRNYHLGSVSYPFVRPAVRTFVERLSSQSRVACSDGLTVTSSTRPLNRQPRNASKRSVHPTGMAVDFRVPKRAKCRAWLQKTLLELERRRVIEATRERRPPHYHVAVFPDPYTRYLSKTKSKQSSLKKKVLMKSSSASRRR